MSVGFFFTSSSSVDDIDKVVQFDIHDDMQKFGRPG